MTRLAEARQGLLAAGRFFYEGCLRWKHQDPRTGKASRGWDWQGAATLGMGCLQRAGSSVRNQCGGNTKWLVMAGHRTARQGEMRFGMVWRGLFTAGNGFIESVLRWQHQKAGRATPGTGNVCWGMARAVYSGMDFVRSPFRWQHQPDWHGGQWNGSASPGADGQGLFTAVSIYWVFIGGNTNWLRHGMSRQGQARRGKGCYQRGDRSMSVHSGGNTKPGIGLQRRDALRLAMLRLGGGC